MTTDSGSVDLREDHGKVLIIGAGQSQRSIVP